MKFTARVLKMEDTGFSGTKIMLSTENPLPGDLEPTFVFIAGHKEKELKFGEEYVITISPVVP
jgi:hypothetical protein